MPQFGRDRVLDTPITESGFIGAAVGAAATGLRPVAELMFVDFMGVCFDQIFNQAAKFSYMFGGKAVTPVVIRTMYGAGFRAASQHSQCLYPLFTHIPGLKVALPSNAYEAKGLLIQAIRDDDPVIFFEHKAMYDEEGEVPDEAYAIPFGEANVTREGDDVTIVAFGRMVNFANEAADKLSKAGHLLHGGRPAHHLAARHRDDPRDGRGDRPGGGRRRGASALQHGDRHLGPGDLEPVGQAQGARPQLVTSPHSPVPFSPALEDLYVPSPDKIEAAVRAVDGEGPLMAEIQIHRHAQMGPGDAGGHAGRLARRRRPGDHQGPGDRRHRDLEDRQRLREPGVAASCGAGWSARARRCRSARCWPWSPTRRSRTRRSTPSSTEFQESFAANRRRKRRRSRARAASRSRPAAGGCAT